MGGKGRARAARCVQRPLEGEWRIAVPPPLKPPAKPNWFDRNSKQSLRPRLERPGGGPGARGASGWGGGGRWWYHQTPRHPPRAARGPRKAPPGQPGSRAAKRPRERGAPGGPRATWAGDVHGSGPPGSPEKGRTRWAAPPSLTGAAPPPLTPPPGAPGGQISHFAPHDFSWLAKPLFGRVSPLVTRENHPDFSWDKQSCHESLGTGFRNLKPWLGDE